MKRKSMAMLAAFAVTFSSIPVNTMPVFAEEAAEEELLVMEEAGDDEWKEDLAEEAAEEAEAPAAEDEADLIDDEEVQEQTADLVSAEDIQTINLNEITTVDPGYDAVDYLRFTVPADGSYAINVVSLDTTGAVRANVRAGEFVDGEFEEYESFSEYVDVFDSDYEPARKAFDADAGDIIDLEVEPYWQDEELDADTSEIQVLIWNTAGFDEYDHDHERLVKTLVRMRCDNNVHYKRSMYWCAFCDEYSFEDGDSEAHVGEECDTWYEREGENGHVKVVEKRCSTCGYYYEISEALTAHTWGPEPSEACEPIDLGEGELDQNWHMRKNGLRCLDCWYLGGQTAQVQEAHNWKREEDGSEFICFVDDNIHAKFFREYCDACGMSKSTMIEGTAEVHKQDDSWTNYRSIGAGGHEKVVNGDCYTCDAAYVISREVEGHTPQEWTGTEYRFDENCHWSVEGTYCSKCNEFLPGSETGEKKAHVFDGTKELSACDQVHVGEMPCCSACEYVKMSASEGISEEVPMTVTLKANEGKLFAFVPSVSGTYRFVSASKMDTVATLYSKDGKKVISNDDDGKDSNFYMECDVVAGQTYYLAIGEYYGNAGTMTVYARKDHLWGDMTVKAAPTAVSEGKGDHTCTLCGKVEKDAVIPKLPGRVTVKASSVPLQAGKSFNAATLLVNTDSFEVGDSIVGWTSSNTKAVTVSAAGVVKANKKAAKKKATITVTMASGATASFTVKVQKAKVVAKSVKVASKKLTMTVGQTFDLKPVVNPLTTKDKIKCTSSKKKIAAVSKTGVITAKKKGSATITVKAGSRKVLVKVTVK